MPLLLQVGSWWCQISTWWFKKLGGLDLDDVTLCDALRLGEFGLKSGLAHWLWLDQALSVAVACYDLYLRLSFAQFSIQRDFKLCHVVVRFVSSHCLILGHRLIQESWSEVVLSSWGCLFCNFQLIWIFVFAWLEGRHNISQVHAISGGWWREANFICSTDTDMEALPEIDISLKVDLTLVCL